MGRKASPGLVKRNGTWHIDKTINRRRLCLSSGTGDLEKAERFLAHLLETRRKTEIYGERPSRSFEEAAINFVNENQHKRSLRDDIFRLKGLMPFIDDMMIDQINMETLRPWIAHRKSQGISCGTINHGLVIVRRILRLAADEWTYDCGLTWLHKAASIKLLPNITKKEPYPLNWAEQDKLFSALPVHLRQMALFAVNTGCRDAEICNLRWEWEVPVDTLETSVFIVPGSFVKNAMDRLIVLNDTARDVIERCRGNHPTHVFTYDGHPVARILNSGWKHARRKANLDHVRVHDLKHTFGRRLRAAGVNFETRQDLLGHRSSRITTHYSAAELTALIDAVNTIADTSSTRPELVILRRNLPRESRKIPANQRTLFPQNRLSL